MLKIINPIFKLCFVTNFVEGLHSSFSNYLKLIVEPAVKGGVTMVQLREKSLDKHIIYEHALALKYLLAPYNVPLIINDHPLIAFKVGAEGVHLGQNDISPITAKEIIGPDKLIGQSIENMQQLNNCKHLPLNYIGVGAVFTSITKPDANDIGLSELREICHHSPFPTMAIGGINQGNIPDVILAGAQGIAVISAIQSAPDVYTSTKILAETIDHYLYF